MSSRRFRKNDVILYDPMLSPYMKDIDMELFVHKLKMLDGDRIIYKAGSHHKKKAPMDLFDDALTTPNVA